MKLVDTFKIRPNNLIFWLSVALSIATLQAKTHINIVFLIFSLVMWKQNRQTSFLAIIESEWNEYYWLIRKNATLNFKAKY